ncbi:MULTISPECIES: methionyl-tRNA formyltransferase [Aliiglaciecola]|uniref:methionyl-tRNA formyltransferase n=1 Tax=Aliiglaciecola TaxID=1406885 RepID=UPI001C08681B|nr:MULTISPECIES: methionyl-tRNA formyltransferase [Aliiglaciecola]MBU2876475.1 methionyl-tRNA formyltransferase [Aliiglaciecola lipolytica]MDO6713061.1 methionyl-tRNA formyltransferase [Aliiglaciecola sp. 2_MG-2023]MDO6754100.1 methionyl-tRNA formyltransferase [Aliiglaciecola sp. 1_MG-2023]
MSKKLNIVFAGTPDFAAQHLQALIDSEHNILAVYSQPDRPAGRGKKLQTSAVKQLALEHNINVQQPLSLKAPEAQKILAELKPDIMIVVAYGLILPQIVLDTPRLGCLNVHGSLLPRWRGAAPIQRSIWAGDEQTGVTIMQMDKGLDTGAMLLKKAIPIAPSDTSASLYDKLAKIGPDALLECLTKIENIEPEIQDNALANYAEKLSKQEALIDWQMTAEQIERNVRAFNPWPVAYFELTPEESEQPIAIKLWEASLVNTGNVNSEQPGKIVSVTKKGIEITTGENNLLLAKLQIPGKKPMTVADIINARKNWFVTGQSLS